LRTTLGGTGLAVSSRCSHLEVAGRFAEFVAGPEYQRTQFVENGGQPGHRAAWTDPENNRRTHDYFAATLPCLDRAYLRPRYPGSLAFQDRDGGGVQIREYMMDGGDPKQVMQALHRLYRESRGGRS
jgi:multiple sugar transport system substrate-binding protein